mgnify:FL=1
MSDAQTTQPATHIPTLINVILDESGSMAVKVNDVIGGFNTFLAEQQAQPGECRLTLVKFNTEHTVTCSALPIKDVKPLDGTTYTPGGMTALLDAVAEMVRLADKDQKPGERVLCLIVTDGEENSSRETTLEQVREIIKAREAKGDWTFTYLGIAPEKWHAQGLGTHMANAAAYQANAPGASFVQASLATTKYRAGGQAQSQAFYGQPAPTVPPKPADDDPWQKPHSG